MLYNDSSLSDEDTITCPSCGCETYAEDLAELQSGGRGCFECQDAEID